MTSAAARFESWARAAGDHPERALWGKARPPRDGDAPAHPLICHILDVQAVARELLTDVLPRAVRRRLFRALGGDDERALAFLALLVGLHDIGKASPSFQSKVPDATSVLRRLGFDLDPPANASDHGTLGVHLANAALSRWLTADDGLSWRLARAVAAHHGSFPRDAEADRPFGSRERGGDAWQDARVAITDAIAEIAGVTAPIALSPRLVDDHGLFVLLAGLTSVADWIGSMAEVFEYVTPPTDLVAYAGLARERAKVALRHVGFVSAASHAPRTFVELFGKTPWPLHAATADVADGLTVPALVVIEAPMGEGKTEAALYLADRLDTACGHRGLFFGLPTQATANQMVGRVRQFLVGSGDAAHVQLVHGQAAAMRLASIGDPLHDERLAAERWFSASKRALLAPWAVGTVDQALLGVLRVRHGFVRLFGLAGKTVVLDEVHAYDAYTSTLLDRLVGWLLSLGASVVLLSATLPSRRRRDLLQAHGAQADVQAPARYPRISFVSPAGGGSMPLASRRPSSRVRLERHRDDPDRTARLIGEAIADGGCAAWICNSVPRAQDALRCLLRLRGAAGIPADTQLLLVHARFPAGDRAEHEQRLVGWLGRGGDRPRRCIVVGTQVLEQSLDVDFDLLFTDIAPVDLVLQRAGRLHRHERSRPARLSAPVLGLIEPDGAPPQVDVSRIASVYEPYVILRTLLALGGRDDVTIPDDIEPLVERVYTEDAPAEHREALAEERERFVRRVDDKEQDAKQRLLPRPTQADDPFADLAMPFDDDDDPRLSEMLRALTRLGPPSIRVICLFDVDGRVCLDEVGEVSVALDQAVPTKLIMPLFERSLSLSHRGLYPALSALAVPAGFKDVALLRECRALVFANRQTAVAGQVLALDPDLGLVIEKGGSDE